MSRSRGHQAEAHTLPYLVAQVMPHLLERARRLAADSTIWTSLLRHQDNRLILSPFDAPRQRRVKLHIAEAVLLQQGLVLLVGLRLHAGRVPCDLTSEGVNDQIALCRRTDACVPETLLKA